jgi:hypothetical protein
MFAYAGHPYRLLRLVPLGPAAFTLWLNYQAVDPGESVLAHIAAPLVIIGVSEFARFVVVKWANLSRRRNLGADRRGAGSGVASGRPPAWRAATRPGPAAPRRPAGRLRCRGTRAARRGRRPATGTSPAAPIQPSSPPSLNQASEWESPVSQDVPETSQRRPGGPTRGLTRNRTVNGARTTSAGPVNVTGRTDACKTRHSQELLRAAYRAAVDLPRSTMNCVADLIRREMPRRIPTVRDLLPCRFLRR